MPVIELTSVAVRNVSSTNVVFSIPGNKDGTIEWGYAGIPDGSDLQEVPLTIWGSTRIRKAVSNGILAEDSPEAMEAAFERQREARGLKAAAKQAEVDEAVKAGTPVGQIVISAEDMERHIEATAKRQGSAVLDQVSAGIPSSSDPMAAINAVEL